MLCPDDDDEIMAEVRRMREEYAAEFGYDRRKMHEAHLRHQAEFPHEYVSYDKDDPHYAGAAFRYEDFFTRCPPRLDTGPNEPTRGEE